MNVSIIGAGYVGLVTGACLAEKGHAVVCVDADEAKVRSILAGRSPFHEPGLDGLIERHVGKLLSASVDLAGAVRRTDLTLLATGTPFDGRTIDLSAVKQAARQVGEAMRGKSGYHAVVVKSTVVPGTTDGVVLPILEEASGKKAGPDFGVGMNPEFLSEGSAVEDFMVPDRIVLGGIDGRTIDALGALYESFGGTPTVRTTNATAEFIKYASNALLATMISYANQIANLCAATPGVDAMDVMRGMHLMRELTRVPGDDRATAGISSFLSPGCGFGGSCLPKDVKALWAWGARMGVDTGLLDAVLRVNHAQPSRLVALAEGALGSLKGRRVAVLGLAFKPGTDDLRETPAVPVIDGLLEKGAVVRAYDPVANAPAARLLQGRDVRIAPTLEAALDGIEAVLLVTRWEQFRAVPGMLSALSPRPVLVDGRRFFAPTEYAPYVGIGLA